jgi:hypothetical protein
MAEWAKRNDALVERLNQLLANSPATKKNFFGNLAWFHDSNQQMTILAWGQDIVLRLGESEVSQLIESGQMKIFDPSGHRPKRDYAVLSIDQDTSNDFTLEWLEKAINYAETLPNKSKSKKKS